MLMELAKFLLLKFLLLKTPVHPLKAREQKLTTNLLDHPSRGLTPTRALLCVSRYKSSLQMAT